ncbi:unnamed protein product [Ranitomeya imitator]|uniref:P-type domain-containing protein n=1 Tax=Ranitomeya imitator TaxID=111125 RepID=A0ABN9MC35_9NEOB|nr:unnamed protein product [Ranitomeya imitator]
MNYKVFCLFAIALIVGSSISVNGQNGPSDDECSFEATLRQNCGDPGITQEQCTERNCCYNANDPYAAWCFYPRKVDECEF